VCGVLAILVYAALMSMDFLAKGFGSGPIAAYERIVVHPPCGARRTAAASVGPLIGPARRRFPEAR
jgi:hypothetical protein